MTTPYLSSALLRSSTVPVYSPLTPCSVSLDTPLNFLINPPSLPLLPFPYLSLFPDAPALCSSIHLGFILVYSTQRPGSLSVLKYLLPKLPNIPKLIVAMTTAKSHDRNLLEAGQELAKKWEAMLVSNTGQELSSKKKVKNEMCRKKITLPNLCFVAGFCVEFLHKCWFRRFSSWQAQNLSDDARQLLQGRKQARALPNRSGRQQTGGLEISKHCGMHTKESNYRYL